MQNQPLVSIITPGYNCGAVVHRLLDSILAQTWQNIEFIFVNDGSTDNTAEVLDSYREKFAARGITMTVIYQENQGQAVALGNGLQHFTGEYLCWCDSDDYYENNAMEIRVKFLEEHPEYGCVSGQAYIRKCEDLSISGMIGLPNEWNVRENQFECLLLGKEDMTCCGCHMYRASKFLEVNPDRYIYPSREGQNIQMLWPMYYVSKCHLMAVPVYNYIVYPDSHSHTKRTLEQTTSRYMHLHTIRMETMKHIKGISAEELADIEKHSLIVMNQDLLSIASRYRDVKLAKQAKKALKSYSAFTLHHEFIYLQIKSPIFRLLLRIYRKLYSILRKILRKK